MSIVPQSTSVTRDAIRSGNVAGLRALTWLQANGDYVFHGSRHRHKVLLPQQAHTYDRNLQQPVPDGRPAVCATPTPAAAIFMALIKPLAEELPTERCALIYRDGTYEYRATSLLVSEVKNRAGYVHVLKRSALRYWQGDEYRSARPVKPEYVIRVAGGVDLQVAMSCDPVTA